ncbi:hypothetical protein QP975_06765 [Corynebacterium mastitidis]|nr:hypothetical protein [Corynebacterium mastitidis]MDK8450678.1 hypothetical protein [Corynebacterium mastitidis]
MPILSAPAAVCTTISPSRCSANPSSSARRRMSPPPASDTSMTVSASGIFERPSPTTATRYAARSGCRVCGSHFSHSQPACSGAALSPTVSGPCWNTRPLTRAHAQSKAPRPVTET